jgi:single-strand DNA-binding protein
MNKVILLGRLTRDPEIRYTAGADPICVAKYTLAVNRRFKREGEPDADFIMCVAFGKTGEFAEKYFKKGQQVSIIGRMQVRSYEKDGQKIWTTDVVVEDQYFADSKNSGSGGATGQADPLNYYTQNQNAPKPADKKPSDAPFYSVEEPIDDSGLPF